MQKRKLVADIILIFALLALALSVFFFFELSKQDGAYVRISIDSELYKEISLSSDGEYALGEGNTLVISDGEAYMKHADCPDKLCINQGKISRTGERIVCLPNKVLVEVIGADEEILIN